MIYKGNYLIISAGGQALAASKSCELNVACGTIPVSSANSGQWEESLAGRKKWNLSTDCLLISNTGISMDLTVISKSWSRSSGLVPAQINEIWPPSPSIYSTTGGGKGITLGVYDHGTAYTQIGVYDTANSDADLASFINMLNTIGFDEDGTFFVICTSGEFRFSADVKAKLVDRWGVNAADVPDTFNGYGAFSMIGAPQWGNKNIANFREGLGVEAIAKVFFDGNGPITEAVLKSNIQRIGSTLDIRVNVPGLVNETLHGKAICKNFRVSSSVGNLMRGSFAWEGTGPLE